MIDTLLSVIYEIIYFKEYKFMQRLLFIALIHHLFNLL